MHYECEGHVGKCNPIEPTELSTDNKAARGLSYNPEHHNRSKV